ncbi:MAG TPA: MFS transporter [Bacteroidales bacterium]|nr:MFS transporter [Bacteroidales bacterium]
MPKFFKVLQKYPQTFWISNTMELFERWAWYGMFMILALYLTGSVDTGALGFTQAQKGIMMGTVVALLYFLPVITGAIADKFGYKKVLITAYIVMALGYVLMGYLSSYYAVFLAFIFLAIGAALFKPVISACIAKTTTKETSSMGFGIFYMMVNLGAFIGPIFASKLRSSSWNLVFLMSATVILINLLLVLIFFKEPAREQNNTSLADSIKIVFKNILLALSDRKFLFFLIIIIGFWTMYNQLFYTLPVFIDQWMDTSIVYDTLYSIWPWFAEKVSNGQGAINPEMLTNIDAMYIVLFQVLISYAIMKLKPLHAMIGGFFVASIGIGLTFMFSNPMYLFVTILVFGLGEMASSPKISEYIGRIAPKDKVALYMGCSFLPMAGGNFFAGLLSGNVYQKMSDKVSLLQFDLKSKGIIVPELSDSFTQNDLFAKASEVLNMDNAGITEYLWNTYNPGNIWMVFTGIGITTVVVLFLYDRFVLSK